MMFYFYTEIWIKLKEIKLYLHSKKENLTCSWQQTLQVQILLCVSFYCFLHYFIYFFKFNNAARGLDFPHIRTVVNYDVARDIDTHTHRIGRTGRAGISGDAITLILADKDKEFAGHLVRNFEGVNQVSIPKSTRNILNLCKN